MTNRKVSLLKISGKKLLLSSFIILTIIKILFSLPNMPRTMVVEKLLIVIFMKLKTNKKFVKEKIYLDKNQ